MSTITIRKRRCYVAVVGAQRLRVAKVVSLLNATPSKVEWTTSTQSVQVSIEYLPCVATFDSYQKSNPDGQIDIIRYLANVQYHGNDKDSSLAPFFDSDEDGDGSKVPTFPGITVAVIGCGIEEPADISMIEGYFKTMSGPTGTDKADTKRLVLVECVTPNSEYATMKDENDAYKALDAEGKEDATLRQTIGPGKMARFVVDVASTCIERTLQGRSDAHVGGADKVESMDIDKAGELVSVANETVEMPQEADPTKVRYACRICRRTLFGEDDLDGHVPAMHHFSRRKASPGISSKCESIFLKNGLDWMGDISPMEGKFACPKCSTKLGTWKWAGAQCSCGTWVTPAIQVPSSKVDMVTSFQDGRPSGTGIISPLAVLSSTIQ